MNDEGYVSAIDRIASIIGRPLDDRTVLHWYDFTCPFCYIGQTRDTIFADRGFVVVELAFQAHPDIPPEGKFMGQRSGEMYDRLRNEAEAEGLLLNWPERLPNSRMALAVAEWVRRMRPQAFGALARSLFAAHFADREDIGSNEVVMAHARAAGVNVDDLAGALEDGSAYRFVNDTEALGRQIGVQGTPAWLVGRQIIPGLFPRDVFIKVAEENQPIDRSV